ncbi:hypothetical protein [Amycolatopsis sp.]|uniref:hypothetical protein n=1 Tax=Amycolatopsis sp. TaxID=37632 RepID=UPI002E04B5D4|nr:hypothetical protein [Amycolatopsis sp.]
MAANTAVTAGRRRAEDRGRSRSDIVVLELDTMLEPEARFLPGPSLGHTEF